MPIPETPGTPETPSGGGAGGGSGGAVAASPATPAGGAAATPAGAGPTPARVNRTGNHVTQAALEGGTGSGVREVGSQATWSLSSCKPGFGVEQLRDLSVETYWQSDGQLPHLVNIQFRRKTTISDVAVYTDFKLDESYTPSRISVRCGTNFNDLQEIEVIDLKEPAGWVVIPLKDLNDRLVRTFMVQIAVINNHQQGRDTHLRQIKIHSPVEEKVVSTVQNCSWTSPDSLQFLHMR